MKKGWCDKSGLRQNGGMGQCVSSVTRNWCRIAFGMNFAARLVNERKEVHHVTSRLFCRVGVLTTSNVSIMQYPFSIGILHCFFLNNVISGYPIVRPGTGTMWRAGTIRKLVPPTDMHYDRL